MALTEIERELNHLRRLLRDARGWNWVDFHDRLQTAAGREEVEAHLPSLVKLDREISDALDGTGFLTDVDQRRRQE